MHIGWALIVGFTLVVLTKHWTFRLLGAAYPLLVLVIIVVTGNHYIFDGIIAAGVVVLAGLIALAVEVPRTRLVAFIASRIGRQSQRRPRIILSGVEQGT